MVVVPWYLRYYARIVRTVPETSTVWAEQHEVNRETVVRLG
jgi:hypothetical protein